MQQIAPDKIIQLRILIEEICKDYNQNMSEIECRLYDLEQENKELKSKNKKMSVLFQGIADELAGNEP